MFKSKRNKIIAIAMIITAVVVCTTVCAVVITIYIQRKQVDEYAFTTELILTDSLYNKTTILSIPNYRDTSNNNTFINDPNILELAKAQLLEQDSRYIIQIYQDSLLFAMIEGESLYYILRRDMYPADKFGMRFSTLNMHDIATESDGLDKFDSILVPYHLFDAFNYPFDSNFPFQYALSYDTPIKVSKTIDSTLVIDTFASFYSSLGKYKVTVTDLKLTIAIEDGTVLFAINFTNNYATFTIS